MIKGTVADRAVYLNGSYLSPKASQKAYNHSPDGFAWGYNGSGPSQLALAILMLFTAKEVAVEWHQVFKRDVIAQLPRDQDFELTEDEVFNWIRSHGLEVKNGIRAA